MQRDRHINYSLARVSQASGPRYHRYRITGITGIGYHAAGITTGIRYQVLSHTRYPIPTGYRCLSFLLFIPLRTFVSGYNGLVSISDPIFTRQIVGLFSVFCGYLGCFYQFMLDGLRNDM